MLFARDGIPSIFGRDNTIGTFPELTEAEMMISPGQKDGNYDPGQVQKDFEGAGIMDNSNTEEKFGGIDDRGAEFNFLSLHINTMTSMSVIGVTAILIGIILYCSTRECWSEIWNTLKCCKCTVEPHHGQILYEPPTIGPAYSNTASAPTAMEMEALEQAQYLKLAKQKKRPKMEGDKSNDFDEGSKRG